MAQGILAAQEQLLQKKQAVLGQRVLIVVLSGHTAFDHTGASVPAKISQANTVLADRLRMM